MSRCFGAVFGFGTPKKIVFLMCGICGIASADREYAIGENTLYAMRDILSHRGPHDAADYLAPGIALGSRRLAILDLSNRGHMPMTLRMAVTG